MIIIQKPVATANFRPGRAGHRVEAIVIHISTGTASSADNTFANAASHVSAHYLVCLDGPVHQFVSENDEAFHAGVVHHPTWARAKAVNPNLCTIGIEHEGVATKDITERQYAASAELIAVIARRWGLPIDTNTVIPHHAIRDDKSCPGLIDINKLITLANAGAGEAIT